jgi:hypothetical protein
MSIKAVFYLHILKAIIVAVLLLTAFDFVVRVTLIGLTLAGCWIAARRLNSWWTERKLRHQRYAAASDAAQSVCPVSVSFATVRR